MPSDDSTVVVGTSSAKRQMTRDEIGAFFSRRQEAYDNLDSAGLAAGYAENCVVESPVAGTHRGRPAVEQVFRALFESFPDNKVRTERLIIDGDHVAQVVTLEGTDIGGFLGLPPTGKAFHTPGVFLFELKDRQILRERRVYDFTGVLVQIGVLKARPI